MRRLQRCQALRPALRARPFSVQAVVLKGGLSADEDLLIEGQFEGTLSLEQHCLTVGANGQVKAEIRARQAVILGTLTGKVVAREKVEIRRSGHLVGDLATGAVAIEEGAYFKGSIEILRDEPKESPEAPPLPPLGNERISRFRLLMFPTTTFFDSQGSRKTTPAAPSRALEWLWQNLRDVKRPHVLDCGPAHPATINVLLKRRSKLYVSDLTALARESDPKFVRRR